jgi:hypothetical protein
MQATDANYFESRNAYIGTQMQRLQRVFATNPANAAAVAAANAAYLAALANH